MFLENVIRHNDMENSVVISSCHILASVNTIQNVKLQKVRNNHEMYAQSPQNRDKISKLNQLRKTALSNEGVR